MSIKLRIIATLTLILALLLGSHTAYGFWINAFGIIEIIAPIENKHRLITNAGILSISESASGGVVLRFSERAATQIVNHNEKVDGQQGIANFYLHFDNEKMAKSSAHLIKMRKIIVNSVKNSNGEDAREFLGEALHTLQDFFSHTNWIELNKDFPEFGKSMFGKSPDQIGDTCSPGDSGNIKENGLSTLTSGYYDTSLSSLCSAVVRGYEVNGLNKCRHGGVDPYTGIGFELLDGGCTGIAKDFPTHPLHDSAVNAARLATAAFTQSIIDEIKEGPNYSVGMLCAFMYTPEDNFECPVSTVSITGSPVVKAGRPAKFTLKMNPPASSTVSVGYTTISGTAIDGTDYSGKSGNVIFSAAAEEREILIDTNQLTCDQFVGKRDKTFYVLIAANDSDIKTGRNRDTATIIQECGKLYTLVIQTMYSTGVVPNAWPTSWLHFMGERVGTREVISEPISGFSKGYWQTNDLGQRHYHTTHAEGVWANKVIIDAFESDLKPAPPPTSNLTQIIIRNDLTEMDMIQFVGVETEIYRVRR